MSPTLPSVLSCSSFPECAPVQVPSFHLLALLILLGFFFSKSSGLFTLDHIWSCATEDKSWWGTGFASISDSKLSPTPGPLAGSSSDGIRHEKFICFLFFCLFLRVFFWGGRVKWIYYRMVWGNVRFIIKKRFYFLCCRITVMWESTVMSFFLLGFSDSTAQCSHFCNGRINFFFKVSSVRLFKKWWTITENGIKKPFSSIHSVILEPGLLSSQATVFALSTLRSSVTSLNSTASNTKVHTLLQNLDVFREPLK